MLVVESLPRTPPTPVIGESPSSSVFRPGKVVLGEAGAWEEEPPSLKLLLLKLISDVFWVLGRLSGDVGGKKGIPLRARLHFSRRPDDDRVEGALKKSVGAIDI